MRLNGSSGGSRACVRDTALLLVLMGAVDAQLPPWRTGALRSHTSFRYEPTDRAGVQGRGQKEGAASV
jgi:hypothetical protein